MKLTWIIGKKDVNKLTTFYNQHKNNILVIDRRKRNINQFGSNLSKKYFWKCLVDCLLTTQQKSGPDRPIKKFIDKKPFPLALDLVLNNRNLASFVKKELSSFAGIRRYNRITEELCYNLEYLIRTNWKLFQELKLNLKNNKSPSQERYYADLVDIELKGFGPKQSRNLLQMLGFTKYEIPIDSRLVKWINNFGFPIKLSTKGLHDKEYYNFIQDGIQKLSKQANLYPCLIDAAIFSSFDQ